jgi:hypothetical protein
MLAKVQNSTLENVTCKQAACQLGNQYHTLMCVMGDRLTVGPQTLTLVV